MPQNRLDLTLALDYSPFLRGLTEAEGAARKTGQNIGKGLESAGAGAENLTKAVDKTAGSFGAVGQAAQKGFGGVGDAAEEAGQDVAKSQDLAARELAELRAELEELKREFGNLGSKGSQELGEVGKAADGLGDQLEGIGKSLDLAAALDAGKELSADLKVLSDRFQEAGDESRKTKQAINAAFENPQEAERYLGIVKELKAEFGEQFESDELAKTAGRLKTLGALSEKNFKRVANAAAAARIPVDDLADDFGEVMANLDTGVFDGAVFDSLRAKLGIGAKELEKYGAKLDANGELLVKYKDQQEAAQKALVAFLDTSDRFQGVAARTQDNLSKLSAEYKQFEEGVGDAINEVKNTLAGFALPLIEGLNDLPQPMQTFIGLASLAGGGAVDLAVKLGQVATIAKLLGADFSGLGKSIKGASLKTVATSAGASVVALGSLAIAAGAVAKTFVDKSRAIDQAERAEQALIATQSRAIASDKELIRVGRQSVKQIAERVAALEKFGDKRVLLTQALIEARSAVDEAERSGTKEALKLARERLYAIEAERKALDDSLAREIALRDKAAKAAEEQAERARVAFQKYQDSVRRAEFDSAESQRRGLESIIGQLSGDALKDAQGELRKLNAGILSDQVATLKERVQNERLSAKEAEGILDSLFSRYSATADQRKKLSKDVADVAIAEEKRALEARKNLLKEQADLVRQANEQQAKAEQDALGALGGKLEAGKTTLQQAEDEVQARTEALKVLLEQEAAQDRLALKAEAAAKAKADPGNRELILEIAAKKEQALDRETARKRAELDTAAAERVRSLNEQSAKLKEAAAKKALELESRQAEVARTRFDEEQAKIQQTFEKRRKALQDEAALGRNVTAELEALDKQRADQQVKAIQDRLALQEQEIRLKQQQANVGATEEQKAVNAEQAALQLQRARREAELAKGEAIVSSTAKLREETEELVKQRDLLQEQIDKREKLSGFDSGFGTVGGLESLGENAAGIGVSRKDSERQQLQELNQRIERNRGMLANAANLNRPGAGPAAPAPPPLDPALLTNGFASVVAAINNQSAALRQAQTEAQRAPSNIGSSFANGSPKAPGIGLR